MYHSDVTHQVVYHGAQSCCFLRHVIKDVEETVGCSVVENLFIFQHVTDVLSLVIVAENSCNVAKLFLPGKLIFVHLDVVTITWNTVCTRVNSLEISLEQVVGQLHKTRRD